MAKQYLTSNQIRACLEKLNQGWPPGLELSRDADDLVVMDRGRREPVEVLRVRAPRVRIRGGLDDGQ